MAISAQDMERRTSSNLAHAVHRSSLATSEGRLERLFTFAFSGLVYPQIWEDPVVDMEALAVRPQDHIVTIASGGCNAMSYLTADPARITALDLNGAHIALNRLKHAGARCLPDYATFRRFFAGAASRENVAAYHAFIAPHLDGASRRYWEERTLARGPRIRRFATGFHRYGLLGTFIAAAHLLCRLHGVDPRDLLKARSLAEQRRFFDEKLAPLCNRPLIRWLAGKPASLYGLGIPPAQYRALAGDHPDGVMPVLRARVEKLACDFPLGENYFAWQAFGRRYEPATDASLPPYLQESAFEAVRARVGRIDLRHESVTAFLRSQPAGSADCYVLLDAQDWMNDADLTELWREITRTARPGARVIFRTAADELLLPGRIPARILNAWRRDDAISAALHARDRSAVYGAFHLYRLEAA